MPSSVYIRRLAGIVLTLAAVGAWVVAGVAAGAAGPTGVSLTIDASDGAGHHSTAHVSCRGGVARATGFLHGRAAAACRQARRIAGFLGSKPSPGRECTQIYGGADTARIHGRIGSVTVDRSFARTDGCAIDDWSTAGLLLRRSRFGLGGIIRR